MLVSLIKNILTTRAQRRLAALLAMTLIVLNGQSVAHLVWRIAAPDSPEVSALLYQNQTNSTQQATRASQKAFPLFGSPAAPIKTAPVQKKRSKPAPKNITLLGVLHLPDGTSSSAMIKINNKERLLFVNDMIDNNQRITAILPDAVIISDDRTIILVYLCIKTTTYPKKN